MATAETAPAEVHTRSDVRKYWSRMELAGWLAGELRSGPPALVGIDHGFSFPLRYFEKYDMEWDWPAFLDDFQKHWPTDGANMYVEFIRNGSHGNGAARMGSARWRRLTEERVGAKSVFHFDVPGSVAKSTFAGLPWLRYLRDECGEALHFWPFDGWQVPAGRSVVAEVYPSLWNKWLETGEGTADQRDACAIATWMRMTDGNRRLGEYFEPQLAPGERRIATIEGWILGAT
jgi:hypothetical protein